MANNTTVESFKSLLSGKNALLAVLVAVAVSAGVVFYLWNQAPSYQVLYSGLSAQDSGAVIEKLREKQVPYRVDGGAISVPAESVYELRMELAGDGLPQGGGIGYEIFDKTGFGVTEFVQKVNLRRAMQGELGRTISQMKEVETARIHLAIPEKGLFLGPEKKARASIILKLRAGAALSQAQVASIVHLVSGSLENLAPEDVTVVDTEGRMWTRGGEEEGLMAMSNNQLEYKRTLEKDLEQRVESMLAKVVGSGKVVARVSAEVDTKHIERTEEKFDPDGQVVRSSQRTKDKTTSAAPKGGVPGVMSNMADDQNTKAAALPGSQSQNEVVNYEISKVVSRVVEPVGKVKRLSVSVVVDGNYTSTETADGAVERQYTPRSAAEIKSFTEMVRNAVGFSEERGDSISVASAPFEDEFPAVALLEEEGTEPLIPHYLMPSIIKYGAASVVALLTLLLVVRPLIRRFLEEKSSLDRLQTALVDAQVATEPVLTSGNKAMNENTIVALKDLARENPQQVAMVLKKWLKEK